MRGVADDQPDDGWVRWMEAKVARRGGGGVARVRIVDRCGGGEELIESK
jgi:hypothetical protein